MRHDNIDRFLRSLAADRAQRAPWWCSPRRDGELREALGNRAWRLHRPLMKVDFSDEETRELCRALETRLQQMLNELVHTSDHAYRDDLHRSLDRLEKIAQKLGYSIPLPSQLPR